MTADAGGRPVMRRVDVLSLGGTIAMTSAGAGGVTPRLSASDLVAAVPRLGSVADVHAATVRTLPGASLGFADVVAAAGVAREAVDAGAAGVVVTQGTDSLEETAYAFDMLWERTAPLVVTGAMRHPAAAGADGPGNLLAAVTVAATPDAAGRGCLVVVGDEVQAARDVAKVHSTRPAAFASPGSGPLGFVTEATARFTGPPRPRPAALEPRAREPPDVALVTAVLGDRGTALRAGIYAGMDGIVLAAMGGGHVPELLLPAIEEAVARVPVVAVSRTGAGRLLRHTYGFRGSERDLHRLGVLDAGTLAPLKARVLLTLALWAAPDRPTAERLFAERAV